MGTYRDKGIVLRSKAVRESDRHYWVFTEAHGKVMLLAKGSRRSKSTMAPHMASFGIVDLMVAKGKVIDRLAGADLRVAHRRIAESLERTAHVQAFLLAVDALTKRELPEQRVFDLVCEYLDAVDGERWSTESGRSLLFDAAIARLLDMLGFALELNECVGCRKTLVPDGNSLNGLRGGFECASCRTAASFPVEAETIKALRLFHVAPLGTIAKLVVPAMARRQIMFTTDAQVTSTIESRFDPLRYLKAVA